MKPSYVIHDGVRWFVKSLDQVDGDPGYVLTKPRGRGRQPTVILARVSDCEPWKRPTERLRTFRDGEHVLEIRTAGPVVRSVTIRQARSSKRFASSLAAIYSLTLKGHTFRTTKPRRRRGVR